MFFAHHVVLTFIILLVSFESRFNYNFLSNDFSEVLGVKPKPYVC